MAERRADPIREAEAARVIRESLADLGDDYALVLDTVEGETGLFEAVDAILGRMRDDRIGVEGIKVIRSELDERERRLETRIDAGRALIEQAMMVAELPKLERPTATLSLTTRAPKVEVQTEAEIPSEFWKAADPKLDKKALADALKAGRVVPGACLSNAAPSLTIRNR